MSADEPGEALDASDLMTGTATEHDLGVQDDAAPDPETDQALEPVTHEETGRVDWDALLDELDIEPCRDNDLSRYSLTQMALMLDIARVTNNRSAAQTILDEEHSDPDSPVRKLSDGTYVLEGVGGTA